VHPAPGEGLEERQVAVLRIPDADPDAEDDGRQRLEDQAELERAAEDPVTGQVAREGLPEARAVHGVPEAQRHAGSMTVLPSSVAEPQVALNVQLCEPE